MSVCLLYTTFPDEECAAAAARMLVHNHLAACCNILPGIQSIYWWEGHVQTHSEVAMFVKTSEALAQNAIAQIAAHHPYENPAIVQLPITGGAAGYLAWVAQSVLPADSVS